MLLDPDEKVKPLPVHTLIRKGPRKRLWENLIPPAQEQQTEKGTSPVPNAASPEASYNNLTKPYSMSKSVCSTHRNDSEIDSPIDSSSKNVNLESTSDSNLIHKTLTIDADLIQRPAISDSGYRPFDASAPTSGTPPLPYFSRLSKNKLRTLAYLYNLCRSINQNTSPPISHRHVSLELRVPFRTLQTSLKRLCADGLVRQMTNNRGANACQQYRLTDTFFEAIHLTINRDIILSALEQIRLIQATDSSPVQKHSVIHNGFVSDSGVIQSCPSSSYLKTTTTSSDHADSLISDSTFSEQLRNLDLEKWGITEKHVERYVGPGRICETFEDFEELLHRAEAAITFSETHGKKIRSRAGFLISRLKGDPIGVPDNYVSLKEKRLLVEKERKEAELQRIRRARKESLLVDFELFKEQFDKEERKDLVAEYREAESKALGDIAGPSTLDRVVQGRLHGELLKRFCERFAVTGESRDVEALLTEQT